MRARHHEFTPAQMEFLSVLQSLEDPVPVDTAALVAPLTPGALLDLVHLATQQGWLVRSDDNYLSLNKKIPKEVAAGIERINTAERVSWMLDRLRELDLLGQLSPGMEHRLLEKSGRPYEACLRLQEAWRHAVDLGDWEEAMRHLGAIVSRIRPWLGTPRYDALFLESVLELSHLRSRMLKDLGGMTDLIKGAIEVARRTGDRRSQALLSLHMGRLYHFSDRIPDTLGILSSGLEQVRKLGDEDILSRTEEFQGLYSYIQGMYTEAVGHLEQAVQKAITEEKPGLISYHTPIYFAVSTAILGQFHRAVGVVGGYWRRARMEGAQPMSTLFRAMLGTILLMNGQDHEALSHLRAAEAEAAAQGNERALFWAQRGISYHHYLEGRIRESHRLAYENAQRDLRSHSPLKQFFFPWMMEMLFDFHERGYESLPSYDFERQIEEALNGININLRGVALRLRAIQAGRQERGASYIQALLERSEADLKRSGDPIQLAKTRVEMAGLALKQGDRDRARRYALRAWEHLSGYGRAFLARQFPQDMFADLLGITPLSEVPSRGDEVLDRFIDMVDDFFPSTDLDDLLTRVVTAISRFFGAERGGLFLFEGETPRLKAGYNLTAAEVQAESFRFNLEQVIKACRGGQPLAVRPGKAALRDVSAGGVSSILCLPFERRGGVFRAVLYHDCSYTEQPFDFLDRSMMVRIAQHLNLYIERIEHYFRAADRGGASLESGSGTREGYGEELGEEWEIRGQSPVMVELMGRARQVAESEASVLILGETGVGKELLARNIHAMSARGGGPFVEVDLGSIPETLVESELFGHEKGAFTGADRQKKGRLELAHKGTLFIDEVGDIPKGIQIKLLRTLQERSFVRVGGTRKLVSDFRLVAATNRDLEKAVEEGYFREDLYYRLNVVPLTVPALKERGRDVLVLAQHFLDYYGRKYKKGALAFTEEQKAELRGYSWPGNVRELRNVIERAVILSGGGVPELSLPVGVRAAQAEGFPDEPTLEELQRRYIRHVLEKTEGRISGPGGAAEILGLKRTTLYSRMRKLGMA